MSKFTVIRDTREKNGHGWYFDEDEYYIAGTEVCGLRTGDYSIKGYENKICLERKASTGEISQNLVDKAFERELERMTSFMHRVIICEFDMYDIIHFPTNSGIPQRLWPKLRMGGEFLLKRISEYSIKYGVPIFFAGAHSENMAKAWLKAVYREFREE